MSRGEPDAPKDPAFAHRLFNAFKDLERSEGGKISQAEFGRRVSANHRRGKVYKQPAVSKWLAGTRPEDPVIRAMAVTLGCDEEWLLTGESGGRAKRQVAGGRR
jgi:hypothetical protein